MNPVPADPSPSDEKSLLRQLTELAAAGMQLTAMIAAGALVGWKLDDVFGTEPWLLLVFILAGSVGGFTAFVRSLRILSGQGRNR